MKKHVEKIRQNQIIGMLVVFLLSAMLLLSCTFSVAAQKDKKKKKGESASTDSGKTLVPLTDEQQIDYMLSEMLGAWQVGDIEKLHATYADDISMVNGSWAPPVLGWTNYLAIYQQQRARMQQIRLDRSNTYIKVSGNVGWACYQWDFSALVDGQPVQSRGQTTVVVEKRNNRWVIVHNHTSLPPAAQPAVPAHTPTSQPAPAKPNGLR